MGGLSMVDSMVNSIVLGIVSSVITTTFSLFLAGGYGLQGLYNGGYLDITLIKQTCMKVIR